MALPRMPPATEFPPPELTFGLELELDFVFPKSLYYTWESRKFLHAIDSSSPYTEALAPQSAASDDSEHFSSELRNNFLLYLLDFLNRKLPNSPKTESLLGEVIFGEPKTISADKWHLTWDNSVSPRRFQFAEAKELDPRFVQDNFWVVGAELISAVLRFEEVEVWMKKLKQINEDLKWNGVQGAWFNEQPHLHVHFGIKEFEEKRDEAGMLETVKNLMALYGLFEFEIEKWLPIPLRDEEQYCLSLRRCLETTEADLRRFNEWDKREKIPGVKFDDVFTREEGGRYIPKEFIDKIYKQERIGELKEMLYGIPRKESAVSGGRDWVQVNLSLGRENKPVTVEFRQQKGMLDPVTIKWWVLFCGSLLRYAYFLSCQKHRVLGPLIEGLPTTTSILDLISFPEEGKKWLREVAREKHKDEFHDMERALEERLIGERIRRRDLVSSSHFSVES